MSMPAVPDGDGFVVGIDFGGSKMIVATVDGNGTPLMTRRLSTDADHGAEQALNRALDVARDLVEATEGHGSLRAAGVVSPGIIGPDAITLAPNVPGWESLALARRVRVALDVERVVTGNDANAAALAESRWGSLRGANPALYLNVGTGVGAAVLVDGKVVSGAHDAAGEIAYSVAAGGPSSGFRAGRAPLEERAGGRFIVQRAQEADPSLPDAAAVFASTHPAVRAIVDDALTVLGGQVANMAILLDPARIAVGGGLMRSGERVLTALRRRVEDLVPFPPEIVSARFTQDAAVRGAAALALAVDSVPDGRT